MTECLKTIAFLSFQEIGLKELHVIAHAENLLVSELRRNQVLP